MDINKLKHHNILINREVGIINFFKRVLYNATDKSIPLLERLTFLCIVANNSDELFEVRISKLIKYYNNDKNKILDDGYTTKEILKVITEKVHDLYADLYNVYNNHIISDLSKVKIKFLNNQNWNKPQREWVYNYFSNNIKIFLSPIGIDPSHPFPRATNKELNFAIHLKGSDNFGRKSNIAIIEVPKIVPLIIKLPENLSNKNQVFILLQEIIKEFIADLFNGLEVLQCIPFKITRSSNIDLNLDVKNIKSEIIYEINKRKYSDCCRLEIETTNEVKIDKSLIKDLSKQFNLEDKDIYFATGPVNLGKLMQLKSLVTENSKLCYPKFTQGKLKILKKSNIFEMIDKEDILIHTPFESFDPIIELSRKAVEDNSVIAIKVAIYRTEDNSELVSNLINASKLGKNVTVSIELFARFDENTNIKLSDELENAGVTVVYGVMKYKVHSKIMLLIRKVNEDIKYYAHLGTGNYNQITAKLYTDFHLMTSNNEICYDVNNLFTNIAGIGNLTNMKKLYYSPITLYDMLISCIDLEIHNVRNGGKGKIIAKINTLTEPNIIKKLYAASCSGVDILLIVRGACSLIPGVKDLSEKISVVSVVGRFLEHNRVYYFYNLGKEEVFISSADWMNRSFFKRIETCIPILCPKIKKRIINEGLEVYLDDNVNAWKMNSDGSYIKLKNKKPKFSAQDFLLNKKGLIQNG